MKKFIKQNCFISLLICILYACSPTDELINIVENENTSIIPVRHLSGNTGISNAFSFDSIAEADAMLEAMQSVEDAESFYNTYISNSNVNNKYLNSIYEYMCMVESIEVGDSINALLALTENQNSLFNVYVEGGDTIVEPLSCFDYRCLVNEDSVFVVGDKAYHLFDTIFITCPINRHAELVEISRNPSRMQLLLDELKAERKEIEDTIMTQNRALSLDISAFELIKIDQRDASHRERNTYKYERIVNKHRMQVFIYMEENYSSFYNRHDLKTSYKVKSHNKWAGIWWIKNEWIDIDISYVALFKYGFISIEVVPLWKTIPIDATYTTKGLCHSYKKIKSYPETNLGMVVENLYNIDFTISNQYMTITEEDFKDWDSDIIK